MLLGLPILVLAMGKDAVAPVTPDALRAHVKFLASDLLEGRNTPSPGLDIAANYIAAKFQELGLEAPNGSYFQETEYKSRGGDTTGKVRNVIAILRGTDPKLKDTYVFVTAHYDHLGKTNDPNAEDNIYNGANDDGSGVAGVLEAAHALVAAKPKRSIVFMTFYGEEKGLVGSRYYGQHPILPLKQSIAQVNLEQIGRTDDDEGPRVGAYNLTGFDYTDLPSYLGPAAKAFGIKLEKHPTANEPYFMRSDNAALAAVGIPSTTVSVAYSYPDYHRVGDHWDKIDYNNMAKVVNAVAAGILRIADSATPVKWSEDNPKVKRYMDAQKALTGG